MKINEILKGYRQEWVLIEVKEFDDDWEPVEGDVLFHSPWRMKSAKKC